MNSEKSKYALLGFAFGLIFPIFATILEGLESNISFQFSEILDLHSNHSLLLIIDCAPVILAVFGFLYGKRQMALNEANKQAQSESNQFFEMSMDLLFILDSKGYFQNSNPAFTNALGWTKGDITGKKLQEIVIEEQQDEVEFELAKLQTGISLHNVTLPCKTKSGSTLWLSLNTSQAEDDRVFAIARDISMQRENARLLKESEERMQKFFEVLPIGIYVISGEGKPLFVNSASTELLGKGIAPGSNVDDLSDIYQVFHQSTGLPYETSELPIAIALGGKANHDTDMEIRRPDKTIPLEVWADPVLDAKGNVVYAMAAFVDVSDRKAAERKMRESESFLNSVVENIPNMVFVKEPKDLKIVRFNKAGENLLGMVREDIIGKNDFDLFAEENAKSSLEQDRLAFQNRALLDIPEEPIETKDKGIRYLHTKKVPIFDDNGKPKFLIGISEDITEKKNSRDEIQNHLEKLEESNRNLDEFAYVVSHDLKAPLRALNNLSEWIIEDLEQGNGEEVKEHIRMMRSRVKRMENLISDILAYSRIGREDIALTDIDIKELINEVIDFIQPTDSVKINLPEKLPTVKGKHVRLQQVFSNLISNAIKFNGKAETIIAIKCAKKGNLFQFSVSDNGPGIEKEYVEQVFGMFQRLHSRDEVEGSGLGLSMVKKIIEQQGGEIKVDRDPELKGARFSFTWQANLQDYLGD